MGLSSRKSKQVGELKQRVCFQREVKVKDGMGNTFSSFEDDFEAWANVQPLSGSQRLQLGAVNQSLTHQVTIRHTDKNLKGCRMEHRGRYFNIHYYLNEGEENAYDELGAAEILQPI